MELRLLMNALNVNIKCLGAQIAKLIGTMGMNIYVPKVVMMEWSFITLAAQIIQMIGVTQILHDVMTPVMIMAVIQFNWL